tara:strand:+ start:396 stop:668 length:273 start_codon:yes stop_codon:yes gene_type:complete
VPRIDKENDSHTFIVQVKDKGSVCVDAFELSGAMMDSGFAAEKEPSVDDIDEIMRSVAWMEDDGDMREINKLEMFAVASKCLGRMSTLGN